MKHHFHQKIGWVLLFLPLLLAALACTSQALTPTPSNGTPPTPILWATSTLQSLATPWTASPSADRVGGVGDRVLSGGAAITVTGVSRAAQIDLFNPAPGNIYLDVEVVLENASRADKIPYNLYFFTLKDANGNLYPPALASLEPSLKTGDLDKGEKARGHIAFEVNAQVTYFVLSFEPNIYLKDYQVIRFDLSQQSTHPAAAATLQQPPPSGKLGDRVAADWIAMTVVKTESPAAIGVYKPGKGGMFLDLEVIIENTSPSSSLPCNPLYFKIKDADGYEYTTALVALDPSLKSSDLAPGAKVTGHVAFEVRKGATGFTLIYAPVVLFNSYEEVSISLGE